MLLIYFCIHFGQVKCSLHYYYFFLSPISNAVERRGKILPEFISSWEDATGFGGKTETSFLLKELDTLRAKNKKVQFQYSDHRIYYFSVVSQSIHFKLFLI